MGILNKGSKENKAAIRTLEAMIRACEAIDAYLKAIIKQK